MDFVEIANLEQSAYPADERSLLVMEKIKSAPGASIPNGRALDEVLYAGAKDYLWAQARLPGGEDWHDMHLAFDPSGVGFGNGHALSGLPENAFHQISIELSIETRAGRVVEFFLIIDPRSFRVADLSEHVFDLTIASVAFFERTGL